jgi:hypothetical protein
MLLFVLIMHTVFLSHSVLSGVQFTDVIHHFTALLAAQLYLHTLE